MPNRNAPCLGCTKRMDGCRKSCVEYAIWDLHEYIVKAVRKTDDAGAFLKEQAKRRKIRWRKRYGKG